MDKQHSLLKTELCEMIWVDLKIQEAGYTVAAPCQNLHQCANSCLLEYT